MQSRLRLSELPVTRERDDLDENGDIANSQTSYFEGKMSTLQWKPLPSHEGNDSRFAYVASSRAVDMLNASEKDFLPSIAS